MNQKDFQTGSQKEDCMEMGIQNKFGEGGGSVLYDYWKRGIYIIVESS